MSIVAYVLMLKLYAVFMLLGSGVLWFVLIRDQYRADNNPRLWAYLGFILLGLFLSIYFIDGWRPT